ncbi:MULTISPECIES: TolC family protein [Empedobacter]|uniref:TolC family protein n=1 Tax=Empedobacter falsenii TaxID=343874 RepID=A0A7H9DWJ3_9FLAO|nr:MULTISPECIES: TolC family protein [Empedobacter]MDH2205608.1 TolC family protein [Empedobacter sp. GD03644]QLL59091.1 TolC family protein [Empedobacter falsenii]
MKNKIFLPICLVVATFAHAQETNVSLQEVIQQSLQNNKSVKVAEAAKNTSEYKVQSAKNNRLPDISLSGQYMHLFTTTNVDIKLPMQSSGGGMGVEPNQLLLGQASASVPVFAGFKIKNAIKSSELMVDLSNLQIEATKENVVWQAINLYFGLYKTQRSIDVLNENLVRANQRVKDFQNFLDNGIIARNDLLRAKLQASNVQVAIDEAETQYKNINYRLNLLTGQDESKIVHVDNVETLKTINQNSQDYVNRTDIKSYDVKNQIADSQIKIAKAAYYPQLAVSAGYIAMDIDKVASVTNATNVGVGLKYDLSSLYKNKAEVEIAKAQKLENEMQKETTIDKAKVEMNEAFQKYDLAKKKNNVYKEAVEQANENYRIVKDKNDNGLADTDDLLEADVQQLQAKINQVVGDADEQLAIYEYYYTTGILLENVQ